MAYNEEGNVDLVGYLMYRVRLRPKDIVDEVKDLHCIVSSINWTFNHGL